MSDLRNNKDKKLLQHPVYQKPI